MAGQGWLLNASQIAALPDKEFNKFFSRMSRAQYDHLRFWNAWARDDQKESEAAWRIWLVMAGRGYGKTRMGAEWVRGRALGYPGCRIALVASNFAEVRSIMVEGESGLLSLHDEEPPIWTPSTGRLQWPCGSMALAYSASEPDGLRGPQHDFAWCDEIAKWPAGEQAWSNLELGLRLGSHPQVMATTTPRPVPLLRKLLKQDGVVISQGRTADNAAMLPPAFLAAIEAQYGGTRLGRQEMEGELIEELEGALWSRALIEQCRTVSLPELARIVIGVDPPTGSVSGKAGDECGIIVCAMGRDGRGYVLADCSVAGASPEGWARAVANAAEIWRADRVIAEANQGGRMVESTLRAASVNLPVRLVHASRGKIARAEPVAALFEAGRAGFAGAFPALEDQLCGLTAGGGYEGPGRSPDRADACVWAMTELMLGKVVGGPRVRVL